MITFYIDEDYILCEKYSIMITNIIEKNYISVKYFSDYSIIENIEGSYVILSNKNSSINNYCNTFISALKKILSFLNIKDKLYFIKDICKNIPVIIFSCGPTSNTNYEKIKLIQDKYIIISVKYIKDVLIKNDINIDFTITSDWTKEGYSKNNVNEKNTISLHMLKNGKKNNRKNDFCFTLSKLKHSEVFKRVINNIDLYYINEKNIINDTIVVNRSHIMLEIAIPFSIFIGLSNIFTFGWDGFNKSNKYTYFDNTLSYIEIDITRTEFYYIKRISELFKIRNINIYKCSNESSIELEYKNILI